MVKVNNQKGVKYAFTQPGILMLGGQLGSERAKKVQLQFIRYFVNLCNISGISVFDMAAVVKK